MKYPIVQKTMRSPLFLILFSLISSASNSYSESAPAPSDVGYVKLAPSVTEYVVSGDLTYDQQTYFHGSYNYVPDDDITVKFKGETGNETLTFDNADNTGSYVNLGPGGRAELVFENLGEINILNLQPNVETLFVGPGDGEHSGYLTFRDIKGDVNVSGNNGERSLVYSTMQVSCSGPASEAVLTFDNIGGNVIFDNNRSTNGVLFVTSLTANSGPTEGPDTIINFTNIVGSVSFTNNQYGSSIFIENYFHDNGLTMTGRTSEILFQDIENGVVFANNSAKYGSCVYLMQQAGENSIIFDRIKGGVQILDNESTYSHCGGFFMVSSGDGLFSVTNVEGDVLFERNSAKEIGGVILSSHSESASIVFDEIQGKLLFSGNKAEAGAGAIYLESENGNADLSITNVNGNVIFSDNDGGLAEGGAIYATSTEGQVTMLLSADKGDITFTGNTHQEGNANAFVTKGSTNINLRAQEGHNVNFYDPIAMQHIDHATDSNVMEVNKTDDSGSYSGRVVFSGKNLSAEATSNDYTSAVLGDVNVYNGTLVLEEGVTFGRKLDSENETLGSTKNVTMYAGTLDITGSLQRGTTSLTADSVSFAGGTSATIKAGDFANIDATTIDMSGGITVDMAYYFSGQAIIDNGLELVSNNLLLGGNIILSDNNSNFYNDSTWATNRDFVLFDLSESDTVTGNFADILSGKTGSNEVLDALYQGTWTLVREEDKVIARWEAFGAIPEPSSALLAMLGTGVLMMRRRIR